MLGKLLRAGALGLPFFLWGTSMVVLKAIAPHSSPFFLAALRIVPAGLVLVAVGRWWGRPPVRGWRAWGWVLVFALIDGTFFQGFLALGLFRTGAGLGSLLIDSQPLAVAVLATLIYKETLDRRIVLALAVGLVGIAAIGLPPRLLSALGAGDWWAVVQGGLFDTGEWLMLGAALSMAVGTVLIRSVTRYADPVMATGWHLLLGGLPLLVASGFLEEKPWAQLTLWDALGLTYASLAGSAIAYGLFFYFASGGNLTALSTLTFSTPLFALLFGGLFLGERLRPLQWVGVALTLVAIYLVSTRRPPAPKG